MCCLTGIEQRFWLNGNLAGAPCTHSSTFSEFQTPLQTKSGCLCQTLKCKPVHVATNSIRKLLVLNYGAPHTKITEDILVVKIKLVSAQGLQVKLELNLSSFVDMNSP